MNLTTHDESLAREGRTAGASVRTNKSDTRSWLWGAIPYWPAAALVPALALGVAGLARRGPRILGAHPALSAALTGAAVLGLAKWQLDRIFTEKPDHRVERVVGGVEIRRYPPRVVAETTVVGLDHDDALSEGFRRLAGYIFGANQGQVRIAMTTPVQLRNAPAPVANTSQRIAMTTPVTARADDEGFVVTFTMPKDRPLDTLPAPKDARVRLRRTEGERVAVLRYRGTYRGSLAEEKQVELLARVRAAGLEPAGAPVFAGYDAPSTAPFLRRVEAWVPIA